MESGKTIRIFKDAVAIVTGGASGIGRALAEELARRGAEVVLADMQIEMAQDVAAQIQASGGRAKAVQINVTDFSAVERLVKETAESLGRLDYIFNNAGIVFGGAMHDLNIDHWNQVIDVNFRGVVNGTKASYEIMRNQGFGHIVNTASMAGLMPNPLNLPYTATKHAVVGLSLSLRTEAAHLGVRTSVICPGVIRTPILDGGKYGELITRIPAEKFRKLWEELHPMAPDVFAKKALSAVAKNKAIIILPSWWKILWWLNRLSPTIGMAFARNRYARMRKEFDLQ